MRVRILSGVPLSKIRGDYIVGHYRGEMGFNNDEEHERQKQTRKTRIQAIKKRLNKGELAEIIVDLIEEFEYPRSVANRVAGTRE